MSVGKNSRFHGYLDGPFLLKMAKNVNSFFPHNIHETYMRGSGSGHRLKVSCGVSSLKNFN